MPATETLSLETFAPSKLTSNLIPEFAVAEPSTVKLFTTTVLIDLSSLERSKIPLFLIVKLLVEPI